MSGSGAVTAIDSDGLSCANVSMRRPNDKYFFSAAIPITSLGDNSEIRRSWWRFELGTGPR